MNTIENPRSADILPIDYSGELGETDSERQYYTNKLGSIAIATGRIGSLSSGHVSESHKVDIQRWMITNQSTDRYSGLDD